MAISGRRRVCYRHERRSAATELAEGLAMTVSDLAHEAAKRYCAVILSRECVGELLERHGAPAAWKAPEHVDALIDRCRRVMEPEVLQCFTVAELTALARFYSTPEGLSIARKGVTFTALIARMLEAEVVAWARRLTSADAAIGGDSAQHQSP
jgi:hypothetical protein